MSYSLASAWSPVEANQKWSWWECVCAVTLLFYAFSGLDAFVCSYMSNKGPLRLPARRPYTQAGGREDRDAVWACVCVFWFGSGGAVCREQPSMWKYSTLTLSSSSSCVILTPLCSIAFISSSFPCAHLISSTLYLSPSSLSNVRSPSLSVPQMPSNTHL